MRVAKWVNTLSALLVLVWRPAAESEERFAVMGVVVDATTDAGLAGANLLLE
jgi:hypothetical protein